MKKDSIQQIVFITLCVCLTCSIVVSVAAVGLRSAQERNEVLERNTNILLAAGLLNEDEVSPARVRQLLSQAEIYLVDLEKGVINEELDALNYDQRKAARDPQLSRPLSSQEDIAGISRLEKYAQVYFMKQENVIILPVRGYGLWSTLYGYLALDANDLNTIVGLTFAEHKETPGLGGEVDNPRWQAQWPQKKLFDENGELTIRLIKGGATSDGAGAVHEVDALSGASLTSRGINNLLIFWFGDLGYKNFLINLKEERA